MHDRTKTMLTITLLGVSLLLLLAFQIRLTGAAGFHFVILLGAALLYGAILFGLWIEEPWAYPLSTVFFALALADLVWMYLRTNDAVFGGVALLLNAAGMTVATTRTGASRHSVETYGLEEDIRDLKAELETIRKSRKKNKR